MSNLGGAIADDDVPAPDPGSDRWPCRTAPAGGPPRLVAALYLLLRDEVFAGDMEGLMLHVRGATADIEYTNPHLESYARSLAAYLTADE